MRTVMASNCDLLFVISINYLYTKQCNKKIIMYIFYMYNNVLQKSSCKCVLDITRVTADMASAVPGPPDLISDMVQPVDLVNGIQRPAVVSLENNGDGHPMPVDMLGDLPAPGQAEVSPEADVAEDRHDARWFSRGTGASNGLNGIPMPTTKDADTYNMNHRKRGRAFVFNHMNFDPRLNLNTRNGTNADRDNLRINLRQLDFDVEVHDDLPFREIERILESASMEDHGQEDCILVAVLSHGELGILYASDQPYKPDRLWSHFSADKCPSLAGKPKLFFIQACQVSGKIM
mgnify:FL=1